MTATSRIVPQDQTAPKAVVLTYDALKPSGQVDELLDAVGGLRDCADELHMEISDGTINLSLLVRMIEMLNSRVIDAEMAAGRARQRARPRRLRVRAGSLIWPTPRLAG